MSIDVININKSYKNDIVLEDINLVVKTGELVALLGPSGSGKTSLLRIIAGLELANSGKILLGGEEAENKSIQERCVGFVFQHYALFKHMTVYENAAFGLKVRSRKKRPCESAIRQKVRYLLELMHLEDYEQHYPAQLSGGQQQRVALVRALAIDPKVLLLDEPFGALDARVRKELCRWLRMLHDEIKVSSIFVTHDQEEALEVANRVCIMNKGRMAQIGTPIEVWQHPANFFVFSFLGDYNKFKGYQTQSGELCLTANDEAKTFYSRPNEVILFRDHTSELAVQIHFINLTGYLVKIEAKDDRGQLYIIQLSQTEFDKLALKKGDRVYLLPKKWYAFD